MSLSAHEEHTAGKWHPTN